ncbi:unnamed protein product [Orchesella dallaii]|uniref:Fibronectin type-III domain-containing protein n=1 Tax=Orchesella dallaii TaxID=48710 RepID=A0ABP1QRR8_9HEXA
MTTTPTQKSSSKIIIMANTTTSMSTSISAVFTLFLLLGTGVRLSDGASVPVPPLPEDLESLASSKILMDHTSTAQLKFTPYSYAQHQAEDAADGVDNAKLGYSDDSASEKVEKIEIEEGSQESSSTSTTTTSTTAPSSSTSFAPKSSKQVQNSYDMMSSSSSLHVAQCRATCLEKFKEVPTQLQEDVYKMSSTSTLATTSADEMHLLPILRLKRKKRSTSSSLRLNSFANKGKSQWSCFNNSPDCFTCWESCELLEPGNSLKNATTSSATSQPQESGQVNEATTTSKLLPAKLRKEKEGESKRKQSIISCSTASKQQCTVGCQVACSFYERLLTKNEKEHQYYQHQQQQNERAPEQQNVFTSSDPVVATKQESIVRIVPGKISWVRGARSGTKEDALSSLGGGGESDSPVVYVVIQEYPDRKWRQIAQTTETELEIPMDLTSTMKTKLRSVRVLVVGPVGMLSVYSPEKSEQLSDIVRESGDKVVSVSELNGFGTEAPELEQTESETLAPKLDSISETKDSDHFGGNVNDDVPAIDSSSAFRSLVSQVSSSSAIDIVANTEHSISDGVEEELFELRRVSLIHQKSLVIAELQWNGIGNNPSQEYLITWELTGGGLKGHLVTDSTSVTLSLWPDTLYQIQVELFEQNLDGDGEQPAAESSTVSLKSLPLIVDTSEASFPLESPSALLGNNDEEEDDEEDESEQEGNTREDGEEEDSGHKSITGFLNMTLVLGISVTALIFVLVILTLAAFTWTRTRSFSTSKVGCISGKGGRCCYKGCFSDCTEPELLLSQEDLLADPIPTYNGVGVSTKCQSKRSWMPYSFGTSQDEKQAEVPTSVAVISGSCSSSEAPFSFLNYGYYNAPSPTSTAPCSVGKVVSLNTGAQVGVIKDGEQDSPSLSSCWLPNATCTSAPVTISSTPTPSSRRTCSSARNLQQAHQHQIISCNNSNFKL